MKPKQSKNAKSERNSITTARRWKLWKPNPTLVTNVASKKKLVVAHESNQKLDYAICINGQIEDQ